MTAVRTVPLWRPVGPKELALIEASGMRAFPPRPPEQPIFYPATPEAYALKIARDRNVPTSGSGFVELPAFNTAIVGEIEVAARFP